MVRISAAWSTSEVNLDSASLRESESAARRCWAPSWRLRSRRRRAASVAATIRVREARTSSSWRFRSVMSAPESRTRAEPDWSRIGVAVQATMRSRPSRVSQRHSRSACGTPFAAPAMAMRAANSSSSPTKSRNDVPTTSSSGQANTAQNARFAPCGTTWASWSVTTTKLGIVSRDDVGEVPLPLELDLASLALGDVDPARDDAHDVPVLVDERGGVPCDHMRLAARIRERVLVLPRGEVGCDVAETLVHLLTLVRVEEDVPEVRPSIRLRSSSPLATSTARLKFRMRPSVSTTERRLGAVLMIVSRKRYCARISACSRSFSKASDAVAATASTRPRWSARVRSWSSAATRWPPCSTNVAARRPLRSGRRAADLPRRPTPRAAPTSRRARATGRRARRRARRGAACRSRARSRGRRCPPAPVAPEDSGEERDRHQREREERDVLQPQRGRLAERADDAAGDERGERLEREEVDGADDPPERRARGAIRLDEPDEHDRRDGRSEQREGERRRRASAALSATRNALSGQSSQVGIGVGSTSTTESGPSVTTASDREHDPPVARGKPAGRIAEDEQGERDERERRSARSRA